MPCKAGNQFFSPVRQVLSAGAAENPVLGEHFAVKLRLPLHGTRKGPRRGGHAPQRQVAPRKGHRHALPHGGFAAARDGAQRVGGLLSRRDDGPAGGNAGQQGFEIDFAHHLKCRVRRIVLQPNDLHGRIVERNPPLAAESLDSLPVEPPSARFQEVHLVARSKVAHDPPHVVLQVGIEELHRPADAFGRKAAQHQHARAGGQERGERMNLRRRVIHRIGDRNLPDRVFRWRASAPCRASAACRGSSVRRRTGSGRRRPPATGRPAPCGT